VRKLGNRAVTSDNELQQLIKEAHDDAIRANNPELPVTVDADARVPWTDVMTVVNLCKRNQIDKIEFAMGAPPPVKTE
jgi:biopolymer transport protein ExbD